LILEALKRLSPKRTVVIPGYVCPQVALAIKRAGLKIEPCDLNRRDFNFDLVELQKICATQDDILAIIIVHLAGIPLDFSQIKEITQKKDIFLVEDCAQALGAAYKGKKVGTLGDVAFFSLCRGKGLTIYEGGVVVTNHAAIAEQLRLNNQRVKFNYWEEGLKIGELIAYAFFYRPAFFWLVNKLPEYFWSALGAKMKAKGEYFVLDFPLHQVSNFRKSLGHLCFSRLDSEIEKQRKKAESYFRNLPANNVFRLLGENADSQATYPYVVLLFGEYQKREAARRTLYHSGLGVSENYTQAITDYTYLKEAVGKKDLPAAREIAQRQLTLSTSTFLEPDEMNTLLGLIKQKI
jgi:dTDP-4-amino-4,6-dideoxygalactose transaminase